MKYVQHCFRADLRRARIPFIAVILARAALIALPARAAMPRAMAAECASGFCVDGFCCNAAGTGDCEACSAAKKGGGTDGECGLAAAGTICKAGHCDGASFSFIDEAKCNSVGTCAEPKPIPCLSDNPCGSCSIMENRFSGTTAWFVAAAAVGWRRVKR